MTRMTDRLWIGRAAALALAIVPLTAGSAPSTAPAPRRTSVSIAGSDFHINGRPTYAGREWNGHRIEGLLLNSRMVQGIFDDRSRSTVRRWAYPDTGRWDADRNTREFVGAMPEWRAHGLLAFTINLQGGSPEGYSRAQPWHNSAFLSDGSLDPAYLARLERVLDRADELGMAVILGYFYFGQDERLADEAAVLRGVDQTTRWVLERGYRNVLIEINNECNVRYDHPILKPDRVHELMARVKGTSIDGRRLLVSTSYGGGTIPGERVAQAADYLLLHGNGVDEPARISEMVRSTRRLPGAAAKPIVFNEDDHFAFEAPVNNFVAAVSEHASWGYFDFRMEGEGFDAGFQSVPVNWRISSARKRGFFELLSAVTGERPARIPALNVASTGAACGQLGGDGAVVAGPQDPCTEQHESDPEQIGHEQVDQLHPDGREQEDVDDPSEELHARENDHETRQALSGDVGELGQARCGKHQHDARGERDDRMEDPQPDEEVRGWRKGGAEALHVGPCRVEGVTERGDRAAHPRQQQPQHQQPEQNGGHWPETRQHRGSAGKPPAGQRQRAEQEERVHQVGRHEHGAGHARVVGDELEEHEARANGRFGDDEGDRPDRGRPRRMAATVGAPGPQRQRQHRQERHAAREPVRVLDERLDRAGAWDHLAVAERPVRAAAGARP